MAEFHFDELKALKKSDGVSCKNLYSNNGRFLHRALHAALVSWSDRRMDGWMVGMEGRHDGCYLLSIKGESSASDKEKVVS